MPDDEHRLARMEDRIRVMEGSTARTEERLEFLGKRLDRHEESLSHRIDQLDGYIRDEFKTFEKLMGKAIDASVASLEAKQAAEAALNKIGRLLIYGACVAVLLYFINGVLSGWSIRALPERAPAHSTKELRER